VISDERDQLLETGGGLLKALPLVDCDPFLVVNSDNLWIDGPVDSLRLLAGNWDDERMDALLLLVPLARANCHSGQGDFHMNAAGALRRRKKGTVAPFVYTGIQMVSKRLLEGDLPDGPFSTNVKFPIIDFRSRLLIGAGSGCCLMPEQAICPDSVSEQLDGSTHHCSAHTSRNTQTPMSSSTNPLSPWTTTSLWGWTPRSAYTTHTTARAV